MRLMEEIDQCLDDSGADAINGDNLGPGSLIVMRSRGNLGKPLDRTECLQQVTRRNRADMANAKAEEETRCIRLPRGVRPGPQARVRAAVVARSLRTCLIGAPFLPPPPRSGRDGR